MSSALPETTATVMEQVSSDFLTGKESRSYYVFWQTANAYGSRGLGMTKENAELLAEKIREHGPDA